MFDKIQKVVIRDIPDTKNSLITIQIFYNVTGTSFQYDIEIEMTAQELYNAKFGEVITVLQSELEFHLQWRGKNK